MVNCLTLLDTKLANIMFSPRSATAIPFYSESIFVDAWAPTGFLVIVQLDAACVITVGIGHVVQHAGAYVN
jgi:hypothetical protein